MKRHESHICRTCGSPYVGKVTPGSFGLEAALWAGGILTCGVLFLAALPYSVWRLIGRFNGCSRCHGRALVLRDSKIGRQLIEELVEQ